MAKRFGAIAQIVQSEPVCVESHGRPKMVMLSLAEYERLRRQDRRVDATSEPPPSLRAAIAAVRPSAEAASFSDEAYDVADYPAPVPGLVIRYSYLWKREADLGQVEGTEHRPCVVVVCVQQVDEELVVTVAPITHTEPPDPDQAIDLTSATRRPR